MENFDPEILKKLYIPSSSTHKGQNGKLMIVGGSQLFHAASLWSLRVASRIVDMVFYSSVPINNEIVAKAKEEFRDGIVVPRNKIEDYIDEADCILIGPGLPREEGQEVGDDDTKLLTETLLKKYAHKKWVIDGGSLQTMDRLLVPPNAILTPHRKEFELLFHNVILNEVKNPRDPSASPQADIVRRMSKKYNCVILLKGQTDIVCGPQSCLRVDGGNAGMTKGGTGDVLAGLVAALYCKNDAFLSASAGSYINKKAGESLAKKVGIYFNASDLADEIPRVMKSMIYLDNRYELF